MIVRQRQRQDQSRHERAVLVDGTLAGPGHAEDRDFRRVDDRRECRAGRRYELVERSISVKNTQGIQLCRPRIISSS